MRRPTDWTTGLTAWIAGRKRLLVVGGVLLVLVAGVGLVALGGVPADDPFTGGEWRTDTATSDGGDGTADGDAVPGDDGNSSTPSSAAGSDPEPADDDASDDDAPDDRVADRSGVNFVPAVGAFTVSTETFAASSPDVEDGFVTPGEHRLLRFDMAIHNVGDEDADLGRPEERPDLFTYSNSHGHAHLTDFNEYAVFDDSGATMDAGKKQTFCLRDNFRIHDDANNTAQYDCEYQGISAGWADVYRSSLPGQYLVIDDLPDGEYTLEATTNAAGAIDETCDDDNTVRVDLEIRGETVTVLEADGGPVRPTPC